MAGSCNAAFTTDDDLAVALSFEGFGLDNGDVNSDLRWHLRFYRNSKIDWLMLLIFTKAMLS